MEDAAEVRRIRLTFEDQNMLSRRQRLEGLKQCWMIVKPHSKTIADIAVDVSFTFQLHRSCPHGVLLSMEGFTLPSSQPTCILKDKDIVSVNKKRDASEKDILVNERLDSIKGSETVGEKLPGFGGVKLLAIDEFEKEAGGYQSECEDYGANSGDGGGSQMEKNSISKEFSRKKRKRSGRVHCSKGEKSMDENHSNFLQVTAEVGDDKHIHKKHKKERPYKEMQCDTLEDGNNTKAIEMGKNEAEDHGTLQLKEHKSKKKIKDKKAKCLKVHNESEEFLQNDHMTERHPEREHDRVQALIPEMENASAPSQVEKKSPSRSAKRKKAKRRWLREQKAKNEELVQKNSTLDNQFLSKCEKLQKSNQDDDAEAEEESLPVIVRPGHIRFEPITNEQESQGIQGTTPALHWNGITNKRQGQNWGKERNYLQKVEGPACAQEKEIFSTHSGEERTFNQCPLEFDKLPSMLGVLQEGDIIAYRLVELSTSWRPELSSFRVGTVASYDCQSAKIRLAPVSEYPFVFRNSHGEEEDADQTGISLYNDDGSLDIDFLSLVDVRWVHQHKPSSEPIHTDGEKKISINDTSTGVPIAEEPGTLATYANGQRNLMSSADKNTDFPIIEKLATVTHGNVEINSKSDTANLPALTEGDGEIASVWKEINQVFSAKKAELALKNDQPKVVDMEAEITKTLKRSRSKGLKDISQLSKQGTGEMPKQGKQGSGSTNPRSFRASRNCALGPTISLLRAQNTL